MIATLRRVPLACLPLACAALLPARAEAQEREVPPLQTTYRPTLLAIPAPADTSGLRFRLSEGSGRAAPARDPFAQGRPLTAAEAGRLLARLPALPRGTSAADSFAFPTESFPAPRTGRTVLAAFPPRDSAGAARPEPIGPVAVRVSRRAPEGEVDTGAEVTITFTQPMVPLAAVSDVAAREVPARISPQPAGRWRWIDTRTLKFEPAGRLPMATVYTVEVPAGVRSALGGVSTGAERWTFSTPAPQAAGGWPHENGYGGPVEFTPVMLAAFDQQVDPAAVLRTVRVRAAGADHPVRLATRAEIAGDGVASELAAKGDSGRWVAFVPVRPLPRDARVTVVVGPGTPSAEGPRRTEVAQVWRFRTYGPLRFEEQGCGATRARACPPGQAWYFRFNNPLASATADSGWVRVTPALPGMQVWTSGEGLVVRGRAALNTVYTVRVSPRVRDRFGQRLGAERVFTVHVGSPRPMLYGGGENLVVLDPLGPPEVWFQSSDHRRLRLRLHRVSPADWTAFQRLARPETGAPARLPGTLVAERTLTLDGLAGEMTRTRVDLAPALRGEPGHVLVAIEGVQGEPDAKRQSEYLWVQSTRLGLAAFSGPDSLTTWVTSLTDGAPVAGARFRIDPRGSGGTTDARGVGSALLPPGNDAEAQAQVLVVSAGADTAFLPASSRGGYARWVRLPRGSTTAWYTFTDRNLYRPGEEVRFKGWIRRIVPGSESGPTLPGALGDSVGYTVHDPRGNEIARGRARLSALGGFDARFRIPEGTNLGAGRIDVRLLGGTDRGGGSTVPFQVQEFRRPEYTVSAVSDPGPHFAGGSTEVSVRAAYYAGGALPAAPVAWTVTSTPASYSPPGWDAWRFGILRGGWRWWYGGREEGERRESFAGRTDAAGAHALRIDFGRAVPPRPYTLAAEGTVTDVNRQTWTASTSLLVHPAAVYVGVRTEKEWLERGDSLDLDLIVVDLDGKPVSSRPVEVRVTRWTWDPEKGTEVAADSARCLREPGPNPARCVFPTSSGGRYEVVAEATDLEGRPTRTSFTTWVWGGDFRYGNGADESRVDVVPDRETYAVGDTARLLLRLPFHPARGLVTVRRDGIVRTETFEAGAATHTLRVPITEADLPNVHVGVEVVGASVYSDAGAAGRGVSHATGEATLRVPPVVRALTVEALPRDTAAAPDAEAEVAVRVKDAAGRPVAGAEVALVVVDEAVLALTGYRITDPLDVFYPARPDNVTGVRSRPLVRVVATDLAPAPGTIVGRVTDGRDGQPLGGASVWIEGAATDTVETDDDGRFRLRAVPRGRVTVVAAVDGFLPARQGVEVGEGAPAPIRLGLLPDPSVTFETITATGMAGGAARGVEGGVAQDAASYAEAMSPGAPPPPPVAAQRRAVRIRGASTLEKEEGAGAAPIALRTNFDPLAVFAAEARTDADGRVRVPFTLPSNLTRYRVIAVAVEEKRYGLGESAVVARQPLMVRPSAPRFLNYGDRFELPVVIQNQTGRPVEVDVAARADGVTMTEPGERVVVPANDRVEVRLAAEATRAGKAFFQVAAAGGGLADAATFTLPVWTPATAEAFATYGSLTGDSAAFLPMEVPEALPGFGGVEVTTSSTALQELTDALLYLARYPYECAEQIASRVMAVAALRDVLAAFEAEELPAPDSLRASVETDVKLLAARQNPDGGFGFWKAGDPSWPYVSLHAAHALQRAREKGYAVPEATWEGARRYLRQVPANVPREYPAEARRALHAYALYVRGRMGERVESDVRAFLRATPRDSINLEIAGWLLATAGQGAGLAAERDSLLRFVNNRATETASTATFATRYTEGEYLLLHSQRRTDGIVLEGLLAADPRNELVTKTVRGLLGHRTRGRWANTQENAWVLLALDRYFRVYEGQTPEFVARVWLGERYAGGHTFSGRSTDRHQVAVPMRVLQEERPSSVTVGKEGPGRLYYRAGLRYAPRDLDVMPLQAGFAVERTYEAVDDSSDVVRGADGRWRVRAGARVRVTVTMTAPSRRVHVALVDPLPAGFEPVNPEFQGSESTPPAEPPVRPRPGPGGRRVVGGDYGSWWRPWWHEHQNLRDDRAEAFTTLLPAGVYTYTYVARATTPGLFIVPPPRAEEMYSPETFGRGQTDRVIVEMREGGR